MTHLAQSVSFSKLLAWCMLVLVLSGCATSRMIDSDVQSYSGTAPAVTPANYRFERLPSQAQSEFQNQLEAAAEKTLATQGLTRLEAAPRYTAHVAVRVEQYNRYPYHPNRQLGFMGSDPGLPWGSSHQFSPLLSMEPPWYRHVVHIVLRDAASGQVAFESAAAHEGPWSDTLNLLPALLDAALRGYPAAGSRKITLELPTPGRTGK